MRILHLYPEINIACGISKTIFLLIKKIDKNHEHHVFTYEGNAIPKFIDSQIKVIVHKKYVIGPFNLISTFFALLKIIRSNKIEILHCHHRYFDFIAYTISFFVQVKRITSVQSKVYGKKFISYKSENLIACSYAIQNHLINEFGISKERITVIHNFVDKEEVRESLKETIQSIYFPDDQVVLGFIGRINIKEKGIDLLIDAFTNLSAKRQNVLLLMIGDGPDVSFVQKTIKGKGINVILLPSQLNIYPYLKIMDILILPSRVEPFGIVSIEAGILKKPFIGSNIDGLPEIINNNKNGVLFLNQDQDDLLRCILLLIDNPSLRKVYGDALFEKVNEKFTSEQIIPMYESIYLKALTN